MKWYYATGDRVVGPIERTDLEALFSSGSISTDTMVVQEGMYDWVSYRDLKKTTQCLLAVSEKAEKAEKSGKK